MQPAQNSKGNIRITDMLLKKQDEDDSDQNSIGDVMKAIPQNLQNMAARLYGAVEGTEDDPSMPDKGAKEQPTQGDHFFNLQRAARYKHIHITK